ncbi:MAG: fructosamine kinase family protein [Methylococcales bacterium]
MHQQQQAYFGWHRNNTIGSTTQINTPCEDWLAFWRERRLGFQLKLAANNGYGGKLQAAGEKLRNNLYAFFTAYQPQPSLLHGDLWGVMQLSIPREIRLFLIPPAITVIGKLI